MAGPTDNLRRKHRDDSDNWELTLADMMMLLLCFFLLIVAISSVDIERYDKVSESMSEAMGDKKKKDPQPEQLKSKPTSGGHEYRSRIGGQEKSLQEVVKDLQYRLRSDLKAVKIERRSGGVVLNLFAPSFFELGSAELTSKAVFLLREVADALAGAPYAVTVEGHTDNIPIRSKMFPSNWELSAVRASSVARFLIFHGIDSNHVKVVGLADTKPLLPNTDVRGRPIPQNQVQNRRVVIVLSPLPSRPGQ
jgi:chemotaxis protein MotB